MVLRSGRIFHRVFPHNSQNPEQSQLEKDDGEQPERAIPRTQYDLLKHLDKTPARISILELLQRSTSHQAALMEYLQKVMVNEDLPVEKISTVLTPTDTQPAIMFHNYELAPREARKYALCISIKINGVSINPCLVDTGASINVISMSTLQLCGVDEEQIRPSSITVTAYDNSKRPPQGMIILKAELGPMSIPTEFYILDMDPTFKAILGRPYIEAMDAVPSTNHQCLKFPYNGRIIKVVSTPVLHTVDAINTSLPSVWPSHRPILSLLDVRDPSHVPLASKEPVRATTTSCLPFHSKGWEIMRNIGYQQGKGLGAQLQGMLKPPKEIRPNRRFGLGFKGPFKADWKPLMWTLSNHFNRGPVVQMGDHPRETYGESHAVYLAEKCPRITKRGKIKDPECEWNKWFDIRDISVTLERMFSSPQPEGPPLIPEISENITTLAKVPNYHRPRQKDPVMDRSSFVLNIVVDGSLAAIFSIHSSQPLLTGAGILMRGLLGGGMVEVEGILRGLWRIRGLEGGGGNVVEVGRA